MQAILNIGRCIDVIRRAYLKWHKGQMNQFMLALSLHLPRLNVLRSQLLHAVHGCGVAEALFVVRPPLEEELWVAGAG